MNTTNQEREQPKLSDLIDRLYTLSVPQCEKYGSKSQEQKNFIWVWLVSGFAIGRVANLAAVEALPEVLDYLI